MKASLLAQAGCIFHPAKDVLCGFIYERGKIISVRINKRCVAKLRKLKFLH